MNPIILLRIEGALVLALGSVAYFRAGHGGWLFALLFFAPDLSLLGYLGGPRLGAAIYNAGHSYLLPAVLGGLGWHLELAVPVAGALIWVVHIGFDRMLGYGLKLPSGFHDTHLGRIGKPARPSTPEADSSA